MVNSKENFGYGFSLVSLFVILVFLVLIGLLVYVLYSKFSPTQMSTPTSTPASMLTFSKTETENKQIFLPASNSLM